ncbi:polyphosphate kinase 1 [Pseudocolwellia sp. HL-MZ19]|uniref:polyphosphate kinase 1 n=1 Tax=unclassified Pseudocolwellia TaxID=2848178 RepID=UPI003CF97617
MSDMTTYFDKELSWLSFNERVLQEAADETVPIVDRIRFLGIYSANLDEFFRVRVANIRRSAILETAQESTTNEWNTLHSNIINKVNELTARFKSEADNIFDEIKKKRINIIFNDPTNSVFKNKLSSAQKEWLNEYFDNRIIRHITPIIINSKTQLSSCIDDDAIYFLVSLNKGEGNQFCLVEIPRYDIDRFIILPAISENQDKQVVLLDDIVLFFIDRLFNGVFEYDSIDAYSMKLTRDAEYNLTDELDESLLNQMSKGIKQRLKADLVRLVHDEKMPAYMLHFLRKSLKIRELDNLVPGVRYRHFKDFIKFPNLGDKELEREKLKALDSQRFSAFPSVFDAISQNDILLYYPYHKFRHFTEFVRQASYDPLVREVKINIYRVAKNSRIIQSLIEAVKNGKKVTVVVELKARFDEEANIGWAKLMKDAGIHVEFGIETLKVHSKLCIITRLENEKLVKYAHIGTGNFHESNARVYTDFALFTKHKDICQEVDNVFSFISHSYKRFRFNHLIVSPLTSRRRLNQLIENEIQTAKDNKKAEITLKLNNLVDKSLINKLYAASQAGVKIRLIVRGMCSLIPGVKDQSTNIKVISIVDSYLEHPRVMIFHNQGEKLVFITSGDWMERNIDHRVEVGCPIYDETLKKRIIHIIELHFKDNVKARIIDKNNSNKYVTNNSKTKIRSQLAIHEFLVTEEKNDIMMIEDMKST